MTADILFFTYILLYHYWCNLITTGATQSDLMLILNGNATVVREGTNIASLQRKQFIAEISYITGKPASANVISKEELTFYVWNRSVLN